MSTPSKSSHLFNKGHAVGTSSEPSTPVSSANTRPSDRSTHTAKHVGHSHHPSSNPSNIQHLLSPSQPNSQEDNVTSDLSLPAPPAARPNSNCPFLQVPIEIFHEIVFYLHPRDVIYLALATRILYFGVLSEHNTWLWYKLSISIRFLPATHPYWVENSGKYFVKQAIDNPDVPKGFENQVIGFSRRSGLGSWRFPNDITELDNDVPELEYSGHRMPHTGVSYKRMLVQTMLGDTAIGCQWCLAQPFANRFYEGWNMRLCWDCFRPNAIASSDLRKIKGIDASRLPVAIGGHSRGSFADHSGVFRPSLDHLIRASYGLHENYLSLLQTIEEETARKMEAYRQSQRKLIFEYIKVFWDTVSTHLNQRPLPPHLTYPPNTVVPHDPIFVPKLLYFFAVQVPSTALKFEWFFPSVDTGNYKCRYGFDPTLVKNAQEAACLTRHWKLSVPIHPMNLRLKRQNQSSEWLALSARALIETSLNHLLQHTCRRMWEKPFAPCPVNDDMYFTFLHAFEEKLAAQRPSQTHLTFIFPIVSDCLSWPRHPFPEIPLDCSLVFFWFVMNPYYWHMLMRHSGLRYAHRGGPLSLQVTLAGYIWSIRTCERIYEQAFHDFAQQELNRMKQFGIGGPIQC